jgi:uroporphyrinogen-III synthase
MIVLPLAGRRILVTRAADQASKLSDALRALGAEPVEVPVLEIRPPEDFAPLDAAVRSLAGYDWLIFTSANSVRVFAERAKEQGIVLPPPNPLFVAAVGGATANAAEQTGLKVDLIPKSYVAESLVATLAPQIAGKRVLLARAAIARDVIPDALRAAGAEVDVVDAYLNVLPESAPQKLRAALASPIDAVTFTSSSSVTHLAEAARIAGITFPFSGVAAISIGPITSQTLRDNGWPPLAEASRSDIAGLVDAVKTLFPEAIQQR